MRYRTALNFCFVATTILWIAWCLYWPFLARERDIRREIAEADAFYKDCLQQRAFTAADCRAGRNAHEETLRNTVAPPGENAFQLFAGKDTVYAIEFMTALCLLPPIVVFALIRLILEICLFIARLRIGELRASR